VSKMTKTNPKKGRKPHQKTGKIMTRVGPLQQIGKF
jgi:hypothetical protein